MVKNKKYIQIIITGTLLFFLASCGKKEAVKERISNVRILEISKKSSEEKKIFNGVITPEKESILSFKVPGKIESIKVSRGDFVKKGDILAELEKEDYNLNFQVYGKKYQGALENYRAAGAIAENATLQFERVEKLYREKAATKKLYDEVQGKYRAAISSQNAARALMEEAEKGVENSRNKLEDSFLRAPYDAYVGNKLTEEGNVINGGTPVVSLISKGLSQVNIGVSENEIPLLQSAEKIIFVHGEKEYGLTLKEIGKKPDFSRFSYPVTLEFLEPSDFLSGIQGNVIVTKRKESSEEIRIPLTAVFENQGTKVWVYEKGTAVSRKIEIEKMGAEGEVIVKKGLTPGDKVVTAGVSFLMEGEKIKPISEFSESNVGKIL